MHIITIEEKEAAGPNGSNATLSFDHGPKYDITIKDPFTHKEEQKLEWYFEEYLRFPFLKQVRVQKAAASVPVYGEALFKQVFSDPDAYTQYRALRDSGLSDVQIEIAGSPK